jgi:surface polysaccharide O-acyltransferase-like enzyme
LSSELAIKMEQRQSNFELLRIITMFLIILHHYNVNSGLTGLIDSNLHSGIINFNILLSQFMAFGGKMGISVFLMISGYFMISKQMKWVKVLKMVSEVLFYNVVCFVIFNLLGYHFGLLATLSTFIPFVFDFSKDFVGNYLLIYIISPFINKGLNALNKRQFQLLIGVLLFNFSIIGSGIDTGTWSYFGWAFTMYCVGAYIRRFDIKWKSIWGYASLLFLCITWLLIFASDLKLLPFFNSWNFYIGDCNKLNLFLIALSLFMFFKNQKLGYNPIINRIAASVFGVYIIHTNSNIMRIWLWKDLLNNVGWFSSQYFVLHMLLSCIAIYILCTIIDMLRIKFIETPIFNKLILNRS